MHFFLERTLKRLEREGNDELLQVHALGPQFFSTPDLYELLIRLELQKKTVNHKLNRLYRIGMIIPLLFLGTFLATFFESAPLAVTLLALIPVVGGFFTVRSLHIRRQHPTFYHTRILEHRIRQELHRRREESSIF